MAGAHYTPAEIDVMPAQDAFALLAHWRDHPPTHEILAAVHRIAPAPTPDAADPSGIGALIGRHPNGKVRG